MEKDMHKEFLNPKSMLTPGIAGALTMLITNTLAAQFSLPPNYTGLTVSFLFGLIVLATKAMDVWLRIALYLLNSLLIFSVALGTNTVGAGVAKPAGIVNNTSIGDPKAVSPHLAYADVSLSDAFFPNWLDGTVPRRKELRGAVEKLDDKEAKQVLSALGMEMKSASETKAALAKTVESARTAEQISQIEAAIYSTARQRK